MVSRIGGWFRHHYVGLVAIFLALGGTAYAASTVGSRDVIDNSLQSVDLKDDEPGPGPVGVRARDIQNAPSGSDAVNANQLDGYGSRAFLGGERVVRTATRSGASLTTGSGLTWVHARCLDGERLISGGWSETGGNSYRNDAGFGHTYILRTDGPAVLEDDPIFPEDPPQPRNAREGEQPEAWWVAFTHVANPNNPDVTVYAVCSKTRIPR